MNIIRGGPEYQKTQNYIYNPSTFAWEAATGSTAGGESVEVSNFPSLYTIAEDNKAVVVYEDGNVLYICKAVIGTSVSAASWQIKKVDATSGVAITWCDGDASYNNTATNLATVQGHSYS